MIKGNYVFVIDVSFISNYVLFCKERYIMYFNIIKIFFIGNCVFYEIMFSRWYGILN